MCYFILTLYWIAYVNIYIVHCVSAGVFGQWYFAVRLSTAPCRSHSPLRWFHSARILSEHSFTHFAHCLCCIAQSDLTRVLPMLQVREDTPSSVNSAATAPALSRACTTSFGSICLGALIIGKSYLSVHRSAECARCSDDRAPERYGSASTERCRQHGSSICGLVRRPLIRNADRSLQQLL